MKYYIGIDPGSSSGSICLMKEQDDGTRQVEFLRFDKLTPQEMIDKMKVAVMDCRIKKGYMVCMLEKVHSMPGQGVSSTFKFGQNYGWIKGMLDAIGIPYLEQPPTQWTKAMNLQKLKGEEKPQYKARKRAYIERLYPHIKVVDNTYESLIMSEHARLNLHAYGRSY